LKALGTLTARAVATAIAEARKEAGLTQRELAARVRRPHSVIGMIESNQRQVSVPELITLAEAMSIDPLRLFKQILRDRKGIR
jgi:transcriptional regulator with XRE-family HTH domain